MGLPRKILRGLWVWAIPGALLALPSSSRAPEQLVHVPDVRPFKLEAFFQRYHCPEPHYVKHYIAAADRHGIDYRLLPAISLLESTCGHFQRWNNHWGWNNAETGFETVASGIDHISQQLAGGRSYKGRDLDGKLLSYNRDPAYGEHVKRVMEQIDSYSSTDPERNNPNASAGF